MNNFDVLKEMAERNLDVRLAPLDNITNLRKCKAGTDVTIGVAGDVVAAIGLEQKFVGGLILADKEQFNAVRSDISKRAAVRSKEQIEDEIKALAVPASDFDTELQSNDTCLAAGAHDALRWALGLAEVPISEYLQKDRDKFRP